MFKIKGTVAVSISVRYAVHADVLYGVEMSALLA